MLIGLTIAFVFEAFQVGAQAISFQTGFGFATTFDPQSQVDSGIFQILLNLTTGLLFFSFGIHAQVIRMLSRSFATFSGDPLYAKNLSVMVVLHLGTKMFVNGVRLALPVVTLLLLVDQGLAALTRLQSQLQLLTLAFPAKIVLSIIFLAAVLGRWSDVFQRLISEAFNYLLRGLAF
jgi:flagellar biosynthetic protein FliR